MLFSTPPFKGGREGLLLPFFFLLIPLLIQAEEMPVGYYEAIDGKQDSLLKSTLGQIIRPHTAIPYGSGAESTWGVFYYSDQDEEGYCMDMYCDSWKKFTSVGAVVSGCNIEHSFAKSWWGGTKNDAYKDCYHLNPSNSTVNSSRSNYPLGVPTKDLKDQSVTGSLKVGRATYEGETFYVFEPKDEYKGDFARAYFYMATCYGDELTWRLDNKDVGSKYAMRNDSYLEFRDWEIEVLLTWHRQDPVSEKETKRMDAVSDFQHNRNPYIDYPELAEYIWGNKKGTAVNLSELNGESTSLPASIAPEHTPTVRKLIRNGQVLIERNGNTYDLMGQKME
ncbi:MAG: endonuclease [Paludibacteraceae bacterium]|nr:endonuclease [Paludibacteraceae bacterium]